MLPKFGVRVATGTDMRTNCSDSADEDALLKGLEEN